MIRTTCLALVLFMTTVARADSSPPAAIRTDYDNLCNAAERSGADKEPNRNLRAEKLAKYLRTNLKTPEVKAFFGKLGDLPPGQAGPALKKAAAAAGYTGKCPIADAK